MTVTADAPPADAPVQPSAPVTAQGPDDPTPPVRRFAVPAPLQPWRASDPFSGWMMTLIVTVIGAVTRFWNVSGPQNTIFDEVYYATEGGEIVRFGYENNPGFGLIVHPPLGKWMIGFGEYLFGSWNTQFGWRFSAAVVGTLSIMMTIRVTRRMFHSDLLGALAGLLLTMEGVSMVLSRAGLLDIFMQFFAIAAFAALVLDRDQLRGRLAELIADGADLRGGPPPLGPRPWRTVAGVLLACLCAVKWSGLSFWVLFAILSLLWDRGAFRAAGVRYPGSAVWRRSIPGAAVSFGLVTIVTYLLTWTGWIVGETSWNRHWADNHHPGGLQGLLPGWAQSLANYHHVAYAFHVGLTAKHPYGGGPWSWLVLGRTVNFAYYGTPQGVDDHARCGAEQCVQQINLVGTPLMWFAWVPVILWLVWQWLTARDWRAGAVLCAFLAGWGAWLKNTDRTMFLFYMAPLMPFLVIGLTMALGTLVGRARRPEWRAFSLDRVRQDGLLATVRTVDWRLTVAVVYFAVIVADYVWMWPIFTDVMLTRDEWAARMWFNGWI